MPKLTLEDVKLDLSGSVPRSQLQLMTKGGAVITQVGLVPHPEECPRD